jgi:hypothetical protein
MRESTGETALQRLAHLERTVRRWKLLGYSGLVAFGLVLLVGATTRKPLPPGEEVLARHVILVDRTPTVRATLTMGQEGGPSLLLFDERGKVRLGLTLLEDGRPGLGLRDAEEHSRVLVTLEPNGSPVVRLLDGQGRVVWSAP